MPVLMNTKEAMHPDELALSVSSMSTDATTWLESSIMVGRVFEAVSIILTASGRKGQDTEGDLSRQLPPALWQ
jgi:hypothetical protein